MLTPKLIMIHSSGNDSAAGFNEEYETLNSETVDAEGVDGSTSEAQSHELNFEIQIQQASRYGLSKFRLQRAFVYIDQHLNEALKLAEIADYLEMSQYHFGRLFKQSMGMTVHAYVMQQRLQRAEKLLTETNLTILVIADQCGFANPSHFAKCFRRATGTTPTAFRLKD